MPRRGPITPAGFILLKRAHDQGGTIVVKRNPVVGKDVNGVSVQTIRGLVENGYAVSVRLERGTFRLSLTVTGEAIFAGAT